jgi:hypothetical protein
MNTDHDWLVACLGLLRYLNEEKTIPPGVEYLYAGVKAQVEKTEVIPKSEPK